MTTPLAYLPPPLGGVAARTGVGPRPLLLWCSTVSFVAAATAFGEGVPSTDGTYGNRMGWFLGAVLPSLVLTAALAWLGSPSLANRAARGLFVVSVIALALPTFFTILWLATYAMLISVHGIGLLLQH